MDIKQHGAQPCFLGLRRTRIADLGQGNAELLCDCPHGFGEGDVLDLLHKTENISGHTTAKAVIKLPRGVDRKRRRLFVMKRTEPGIVLRPSLLQLDVVADYANDVRLLLYGFLEVAGFGHGWRYSCPQEL
jgi:hypothetical protein